MSSGGIWRLTPLGKKRASSIYPNDSGDGLVEYLRENKTASVEELSNVSGKPTAEVRSFLRKLEKQGLVERLGG